MTDLGDLFAHLSDAEISPIGRRLAVAATSDAPVWQRPEPWELRKLQSPRTPMTSVDDLFDRLIRGYERELGVNFGLDRVVVLDSEPGDPQMEGFYPYVFQWFRAMVLGVDTFDLLQRATTESGQAFNQRAALAAEVKGSMVEITQALFSSISPPGDGIGVEQRLRERSGERSSARDLFLRAAAQIAAEERIDHTLGLTGLAFRHPSCLVAKIPEKSQQPDRPVAYLRSVFDTACEIYQGPYSRADIVDAMLSVGFGEGVLSAAAFMLTGRHPLDPATPLEMTYIATTMMGNFEEHFASRESMATYDYDLKKDEASAGKYTYDMLDLGARATSEQLLEQGVLSESDLAAHRAYLNKLTPLVFVPDPQMTLELGDAPDVG